MLFGTDTVKPDVHIIRRLFELLNRDVLDVEAPQLLEMASKREGISARDVDAYIWKIGAKPQQRCC